MLEILKSLSTIRAPKAVGPYSQGVVINDSSSLIFVSGQLPIDPKTGKLIIGEIKALTRQVLDNIEEILKEAMSDLQHVIRTEVFLKDLKDFAAMNEEYASRFNGKVLPARQTIQVADLPMSSPIEISCIAIPFA